ncbi:flagellar biosynthesis anti-sigma factor FlgM [Sphingopyxis sp. R3-92]|uniref:flagellar biosynthesis anti-sigma factor FlgM n=1 Tax=Sphingopyxis sp. R3-92 TaxID=3158553 RepID=UPI003EE64954
MSGDSKIGLQAVSGYVRTGAPRKLAGEAAAPMRATAPALAARDPLPATRLIGLAGELADQGPTVDVSRVATLRTAIANGSYTADPAVIARAMVQFHRGNA